jgi:predicted cupin superfamily sugar epimerase
MGDGGTDDPGTKDDDVGLHGPFVPAECSECGTDLCRAKGAQMTEAEQIIAELGLERHPEGGWYRQTWAGPEVDGRAVGTAIYFLLQAGERSHWHRVDAGEVWLWHAGAPLALRMAEDAAAPVEVHILGPNVLGGQRPQAVVPVGWWQAAESGGGWSLVSCTVSPGFRFEGFELAPRGFTIGGW